MSTGRGRTRPPAVAPSPTAGGSGTRGAGAVRPDSRAVRPNAPSANGADPHGTGPQQERTASRVRDGRLRGGAAWSRPRSHESVWIAIAGRGRGLDRHDGGRSPAAAPSAATNPSTPNAPKPIAAEQRSDARRGRRTARPERERDERHDDLERELVVRPEQLDDELLGTRRLQVDHHLADRVDKGRRARQHAPRSPRDRRYRGRPRPRRPAGEAGDGAGSGRSVMCSSCVAPMTAA